MYVGIGLYKLYTSRKLHDKLLVQGICRFVGGDCQISIRRKQQMNFCNLLYPGATIECNTAKWMGDTGLPMAIDLQTTKVFDVGDQMVSRPDDLAIESSKCLKCNYF